MAFNGLPFSDSSRPSNPAFSGFSHGAFQSNRPSGGGFRERQGVHIPPINTSRLNPSSLDQSGMQTPGTAYDMNYTPLLPSQLLMGSPFQPAPPSAFASPQMPNFPSFSTLGQAPSHRSHQDSYSSLGQPQQHMSQHAFSDVVSNSSLGGPQFYGSVQQDTNQYNLMGNNFGNSIQASSGLASGTSRTVYLGNVPSETSAEEILGHVRSGQIESVRLLPDKNCAFISFLDSGSAVHFHSDAILKKLSIKGQDIKIGWGKPSPVPTSVMMAVRQSGASRNIYLGNLPADISEEEIMEDVGKYGPIDTIKIVRDKSIAFVHFLSIANAVKAVTQLPQEPKWQPPRRVFYGKDRCAYVSKTQQQNAAQYLGIAPGYSHVLNSADRDIISNALAQQSVAAAAVATAAGGANNLGNRTVYLGNIHPETTAEEICNVVRGGLLHHIRYIPDKHICFVTFIDPTAAASFYALSNLQGLMIHNRRLKIGWGKHSGALPPAIALAVSGGASRNVYIGNIDETWSEERLRQDFSEHGEIELVNTLREKSCAFVNFTNIANAIKAIEAVRDKEDYKRFKINFGKDRCGNQPRQVNQSYNQSSQPTLQLDDGMSSPPPNPAFQLGRMNQNGAAVSPTGSGASSAHAYASHLNSGAPVLNSSSNNPLTMYLDHVNSQGGSQQQTQEYEQTGAGYSHRQQQYQTHAPAHQQQQQSYVSQQNHSYLNGLGQSNGLQYPRSAPLQAPQSVHQFPGHGSSSSYSTTASANGHAQPAPTVNGFLAPLRTQHNRAISLPVFTQGPLGQPQRTQQHGLSHLSVALNTLQLDGGMSANGYGLAIQGDDEMWVEDDVQQ